MSDTTHPSDELQQLLDERLDGTARAAVEAHLEECGRCRREHALLREQGKALRRALRAGAGDEAAARTDLLAVLDRVERPAAARGAPSWSWPLAAGLAGVALAAAFLSGVFRREVPVELPTRTARDFLAFQAGELPLQKRSSDVAEVQSFFESRQLGFEARVLDLDMMGYRAVGGSVLRSDGAARAVFAYRGPAGEDVICQMFPGVVVDLPRDAERRRHEGIDFFVYVREGLTIVFWQEGPVVCVLVSDTDADTVIQLAFDKAMAAVTAL